MNELNLYIVIDDIGRFIGIFRKREVEDYIERGLYRVYKVKGEEIVSWDDFNKD